MLKKLTARNKTPEIFTSEDFLQVMLVEVIDICRDFLFKWLGWFNTGMRKQLPLDPLSLALRDRREGSKLD